MQCIPGEQEAGPFTGEALVRQLPDGGEGQSGEPGGTGRGKIMAVSSEAPTVIE